jgi:hypothetical protein
MNSQTEVCSCRGQVAFLLTGAILRYIGHDEQHLPLPDRRHPELGNLLHASIYLLGSSLVRKRTGGRQADDV